MRHRLPRGPLLVPLLLLPGWPAAVGSGQQLASRADRPVVNAPVAPDTIYVTRFGAAGGLSVIDLNGFGASTGNPEFDLIYGPGSEGKSAYPWNPNVALQGALLIPPLAPGDIPEKGGSAGVFTLTRGSDLEDQLVRYPTIASVGDVMLGQPLDRVFNNGLPFGCDAGGGNLCAYPGLQFLAVEMGGPHTLRPADPLTAIHTVLAGGNPISFAPHPNPPAWNDPPLCVDPAIPGLEPTSVDVVNLLGLVNLLVPGDAFGDPFLGIPPTGLLSPEQNAYFQGPSAPQSSIGLCSQYMIRQQVGHFLYVVDRLRAEIVVLNSNTFTVLERIPVGDPVELAMSPAINYLAVADRRGGRVWFVDIDPASFTFHRVVKIVDVGTLPQGIAWEPGNEDLFVCNEGDDTVSVISAFTLEVRKTLSHDRMIRPFAVAITPRQDAFGFQRDVYFAWLLDRKGHVFLFESGPATTNGWGYDDIVGMVPMRFAAPRAIQPDHRALGGGVWIAHRRQLDETGHTTGVPGGAVSNLLVETDVLGRVPIEPGSEPNFRDLSFRIAASIGSDQLGGFPTDLAFDDLRNLGALPNHVTPFSAGPPAVMNGKGLVRNVPGVGFLNTNEPTFLFAPVRGTASGAEEIAVIHLDSGVRFDTNAFHAGSQAIPAPGARLVMDYFRQ